ncbi:MAG TPA: peptidoglycan-associated lipoprotein Pal [Dissulfurispiraceae bacterium]|nr:peptidoglycan-associated lipoprotein Pal [Dissulfurispiraceae bacterium]
MKHLLCAALILALVAGLAGCAKKKVAQPAEQAAPGATESLIEGGEKTTTPSTQEVPKDMIAERALKPGEVGEKELTAEELGAKVQDVYFDYDRYDVRDNAKPATKEVAALLAKNKGVKVIIEGHCDERGTSEYNLALGERRAKAVKDYLLSLGVAASRIETVSYGEEKPLCTESTESCWSKNRRAHFVFVKETR